MESLVEKGEVIDERGENVVVGRVGGEDEVFEEAREQLPLVKAVTGDVNEEEVYVTPVIGSEARSEGQGAAFDEVIGFSPVFDSVAKSEVEGEEIRSTTVVDDELIGVAKSGFVSGGKTYAEVLVERLDDGVDKIDNVKDTDDVGDNGRLTESLHQGDELIVHEVEENGILVTDEHQEETSVSTKASVMEINNGDASLEDQINGVLSSELDHFEELKGEPAGTVTAEIIDDVGEKSSNLDMSGGVGQTALSEGPIIEGSEVEVDKTVPDRVVAETEEDIVVVHDSHNATEEHSEKSTAPEDNRVERPVKVDLVAEHPNNVTVQGKHHTVSNVTGNQVSSEVIEREVVTDKELKKQDKKKETPPAVPSSSSDSSVNAPTLPARPAGLGRAAPLLESSPRVVQQPRVNGSISQAQAQLVEETANGENEENDETREKLQMIRVKFLRLARRLGQTPHNVVVAQVLYRLGLAEQLRGRTGGRVAAFSFDRASAMAEQLEAVGQEPLDFCCTIMVLGKSGVGKSATINSIFDEVKFGTDAFKSGTKKVQDVVGTVQGIKVRVIDTPGLLTSWSDQNQNEKTLDSVKRFIKKSPPDIVLYLDRLDMQSREFGDMPLLRTITKVFGPSIWFNAIVVLTHAGSAPPDGPNGTASSYDNFVTQRSHVVQHSVRQAAGDMRLMNPVSLVENHSACRTNRAGQRVLPNGQVWKPHLLLLSFASKILAEANTLLNLQDGPPGKMFATRSRAPPLPYLLSSMLQSRPHLRLPEEQIGGDDSPDDELEDSSGSDDDSEYDELPPFKPLSKAQLSNLSKAQKKAYYDELEYREKLLMKKQLKEDKLRRKMMKKMAAAARDIPKDYSENVEEENGGAASEPVPMPDLALPASFDSDNPSHRYRHLDSSNPWLVRPVLETQGWDHDVGYEGINVERSFVVKEKVPLSFSGQITKDKKEANVQMEVAGTLKHGEGKATSVGLDLQTVGKDIAYTLRSESTFCNFTRNKGTAGMSFTLLGDALSAGLKLEDKLIANKRFRMILTGGAMTNLGDIAYGGSLEATLRDKDHPLGRSLSTLGLSVMDWHGDLAIGCNIQSQIPIGRYSNIIARANLNNKSSGQISIRVNSGEQIQIALIALLPLLRKAFSYSQEVFQD